MPPLSREKTRPRRVQRKHAISDLYTRAECWGAGYDGKRHSSARSATTSGHPMPTHSADVCDTERATPRTDTHPVKRALEVRQLLTEIRNATANTEQVLQRR